MGAEPLVLEGNGSFITSERHGWIMCISFSYFILYNVLTLLISL